MKTILSVIAGFIICNFSYAQTETVNWNGKTYYVYPHQQEVTQSQYLFLQFAEYREVLQRDENNQKVVSSEIRKIEQEDRYAYYRPSKPTKAQKQQEKFMRDLMSKKPDLFYQYGNNTEQDITPALTAIPDGEYIQYYRDLPYLDNNIVRFRNDVVAGVFTIKNNQLEGSATWFTANGMVLRQGSFSNGSRTGHWVFQTFTPKEPEDESIAKRESFDAVLQYLLDPSLQYDTTAEHQDYLNGLRHGEFSNKRNNDVLVSGHYSENEESGTWEVYSYKFRVENEMAIYTDTLILISRFTYAKDKNQRGKGIIIRDDVVDPNYLYYEEYAYMEDELGINSDSMLVLYNEFDYDGEFMPFGEFYTILDDTKPNDDGLELPEEAVYSYEGEEYDSEYPMYDEMDYRGEGYYDEYGSEFINGKLYTRNELIDSIGYHFLYEGVYEQYYANGQLKFRFEVRDGQLVKEEPVYWENGNPANIIRFDEEKKQYVEEFYDYKGKLYSTKYFDEKGNAIEDASDDGAVVIDGLKYYTEYEMNSVMYYSDREKLEKEELTERSLIEAGRWTRDSVLFMYSYLDPATKSLDHVEYNVMGDVYETHKVTFGDEYETANGLINKQLGSLRLETTANGSKYDYTMYPFMAPRNDSAHPQSNALYWQGNYELQSDDILYQNDKPFTGSFSLQSRTSGFKVSASEKAIHVQVPDNAHLQRKLGKAIRKYYKKGKRDDILQFYTGDFYYGATSGLMYDIFPHISFLFTFDEYDYRDYDYEYNYEYMEGGKKPKKKKIEYPYDKTITGQYLDGKPEGEWVVKDQFGNVTARLTFKKGDRSGDAYYYETEYPKTEDEMSEQDQYIEKYHTYIFDAAPEKKTHYLSRHEYYVNGMLEGPAVGFNWKGDTLQYDDYHEGYQHGLSYQRNKIFYSVATYEDGAIDGISQTYLTIPGRDSILIFDLNFQNGSLQGESKSYHTNGKLAKRGFFLSGQPIDDYEAYDTLGFKYQYVKFQYNQPVEEKIWEENQLSVRYLFDWKDSIPFYVEDIAASSSFERLAVDLGLIRNPYMEPYYGRPSLLDKTGINYEITKYYPNDTIARTGKISKGKKVGYWKHFSYEGKPLYEITYFDTLLTINDSVKFKSKGILTYLDEKNRPLSKSYIIEKIEKYDCSHTDHSEERMLYGFWDADPSQQRINGYAKNYYDNGAIQNEGRVENGLPTGIWKLYDSDGQLSQVGNYVQGKRHGRWLSGDLSNVKNMGEICLNPNLENLEEIMAYQEKLLDVSVVYYHMGKIVKREYYGINRNNTEAPDEYGEEDMYYRE